MKKILYLTDLYYEAKGRKYYEEDLYITGKLKERFEIAISHPKNSKAFEPAADLVVFRNTGSVIGFQDVYNSFVKRVRENNIKTFNEFSGKADMRGKQYLVDLTAEKYPVIPTVDALKNIGLLPDTENYVIKPKGGADSIGLEFLTSSALREKELRDGEFLMQPAIDFQYEVSFYFINEKLEYAMYAPDKTQRWRLEPYAPNDGDIAFAEKFIKWNGIKNGIQRVDACRAREGGLLLVELEDLNPYLSILELPDAVREKFMRDMTDALNNMF